MSTPPSPPGRPADADLREFYDRQYHFGEDIDRPNPDRLWHALSPLEPLAGTRFLDLGCGVGWATRIAEDRGHVALPLGLDFSRTALSLAQRATRPDSAARWIVADGTRLPFADASFDRAFSFGSMEHFPDVQRGFDELARVLRPGALAVTVVPNFYVRTAQLVEHRDTERGWRRLITNAGLDVVRVGADTGPALFKNRRPLRIALRLALRVVGTLPPLRYQFIFVMRKPGSPPAAAGG
jgi:SAM-dependent methyltransferase